MLHLPLFKKKLKTASLADEFCIMGDLNARFGHFVRDIPKLAELPNSGLYSYPSLPDPVRNPNDNAYIVSTICIESEILILNNLKTQDKHFVSNKTYCKGREWVSELDICAMSPTLVSSVSDFCVIKDDSLPSDHAPVSLNIWVIMHHYMDKREESLTL